MTQIIDIDHANVQELTRLLALKPCPECVPLWRDSADTQVCQHGTACDIHCCTCHSGFEFSTTEHTEECRHCSRCRDSGLANPWASEECLICNGEGEHSVRYYYRSRPEGREQCKSCNGSGRVPKAVGLEDVMQSVPFSIWEFGCALDGRTCELTAFPPGSPKVISFGEGETPLLAALRAIANSLIPSQPPLTPTPSSC